MRDVTLDGRYLVGDQIGAGATATVYRAQDLVLGRHVAIKVVKRPGLDGEEARKRFTREAQLAARFQHAGAVEVYAVGDHGDQSYLVMALVEAPTFRALLDESTGGKPLPLATVSVIGAALADVLAAAHAQQLVHRDVKPANVFVEGGRTPTRVRLADFGLAFARDEAHGTLGRLTEDGVTLGTPYYMAPEQIEGKDVTGAADVYALCASLYEAIAHRPLFLGRTIPTILAGHLYLPVIPLSELDLFEAVPPELEAAILAGLAKTPAHRPDAATLAARLREPSSGRGDRTRPAGPPPAKLTREPVRVWTSDEALGSALRAAGIAVQRDCDVEVLVVTDSLPAARSTTPTVVARADISPAWVTAAIRAGHAGATRWPGDVAAIVRVVERFGRLPSAYPRERERTE
ncbi:MAG: serine/threonine-protein kinase [Kofleriaceae bacterium]